MSQVKDAKASNGSDGEGDTLFPTVLVEGVCIPKFFETNRPMTEHIECLKALEMREDDVVLMAYTKAGTHWLWEIATMLIGGKADYDPRAKENLMMEARSVESIQAEASPRILNSHLPFKLLPRQIAEKKVKVLHVYRNVKDVFVSMFFHYRQIPGCQDLSWERFERIFLSDKLPTGNYITYLKEFQEVLSTKPDLPVFNTSFEDLKEDPEKVVERLAGFLQVEASPKLVKDIAEATGFAKLKKADEQKVQSFLPPTNYYRKGEVGDWKNHMTMAQSERFDAAIKQLESCDFRFRYTL